MHAIMQTLIVQIDLFPWRRVIVMTMFMYASMHYPLTSTSNEETFLQDFNF